MKINEIILHQLWQASEDRKVCRISLEGEPLPRLIAPYGICQTGRNKIMLVCQQRAGFTKAGGTAGYRNLELARITEVEITTQGFSIDEGFNPEDGQYKDWVFHL